MIVIIIIIYLAFFTKTQHNTDSTETLRNTRPAAMPGKEKVNLITVTQRSPFPIYYWPWTHIKNYKNVYKFKN